MVGVHFFRDYDVFLILLVAFQNQDQANFSISYALLIIVILLFSWGAFLDRGDSFDLGCIFRDLGGVFSEIKMRTFQDKDFSMSSFP